MNARNDGGSLEARATWADSMIIAMGGGPPPPGFEQFADVLLNWERLKIKGER